jgi:hypothetical protein
MYKFFTCNVCKEEEASSNMMEIKETPYYIKVCFLQAFLLLIQNYLNSFIFETNTCSFTFKTKI